MVFMQIYLVALKRMFCAQSFSSPELDNNLYQALHLQEYHPFKVLFE